MDNSTTLRQALTLELLRAQHITSLRTRQTLPRQGTPAVPTSAAGATNITGAFMIGISTIGGTDVIG